MYHFTVLAGISGACAVYLIASIIIIILNLMLILKSLRAFFYTKLSAAIKKKASGEFVNRKVS